MRINGAQGADERMRIIVTGAFGFIGSAAIARLVREGHDVVAATRRDGACPAPVEIVGDIDSQTDWRSVLSDADCVVHLAARVHEMHSPGDLEAYREVNTRGTLRLAESAATAGVPRFVYLSSAKVLGETSGDRAFDDASSPAPVGPYAISKYEAEIALTELAAHTGMTVVVLRPPLVYGPGVRANFLRLLQWVDRGFPLPLGAVQNRRSLVALDNLVDAIATCAVHPEAVGKTFLVADDEPLSTPQLIRRIAAAMNRSACLIDVPPAVLRLAGRLTGRTAEVDRLLGDFWVDSSGIRSTLGWHPPIPVDDALARTVAWYLDQRVTK